MKKSVQAMLLLLSLQLISFVAFIWLSQNAGTNYDSILKFIFILLIFADLILLRNLQKNFQLDEIKNQLEMANAQKNMEASYEKKMKEWTEEIAASKQLLKEQLREVDLQLSRLSGSGSSVLPLLDSISSSLSKTKSIYFCDHALTNVILAEKYKIAVQNDIAVSVQAAIPSILNITDSEVCSIWCNLLDNAINACKEIDAPKERWIKVKSMIQNGYLYIKIENSTVKNTGAIKIQGESGSRIEHGYGLRIIRELAHKNGGELILTQEAERFISIFTIAADSHS